MTTPTPTHGALSAALTPVFPPKPVYSEHGYKQDMLGRAKVGLLQAEVGNLKAENAALKAARPDVDALVKALGRASETIEEMDRIHHDLMDNGPRCTCGDGDEWCVRCARSIKLSDRASSAIKKLDAALQAATDARPDPSTLRDVDALVKALEEIARIGETELVHVHPAYGSAPHQVARIARAALARHAKGGATG